MLDEPGGERDRAWRTRAFWIDVGILAWAGLGLFGVMYVLMRTLVVGVL